MQETLAINEVITRTGAPPTLRKVIAHTDITYLNFANSSRDIFLSRSRLNNLVSFGLINELTCVALAFKTSSYAIHRAVL